MERQTEKGLRMQRSEETEVRQEKKDGCKQSINQSNESLYAHIVIESGQCYSFAVEACSTSRKPVIAHISMRGWKRQVLWGSSAEVFLLDYAKEPLFVSVHISQ